MRRNPGLPVVRTAKQPGDHVVMTPELRKHLEEKSMTGQPSPMPEVKTDLMACPFCGTVPTLLSDTRVSSNCDPACPCADMSCLKDRWNTRTRTPASAEEIEAVARALAVQNGRAKGNCDCAMCMRAIEVEQDNARAAIAALQATSVNMEEEVERDACEMCLGAKGGVPGNENIIGGVVMCDYCHADKEAVVERLTVAMNEAEANNGQGPAEVEPSDLRTLLALAKRPGEPSEEMDAKFDRACAIAGQQIVSELVDVLSCDGKDAMLDRAEKVRANLERQIVTARAAMQNAALSERNGE
jgi:hypothetical protein